MVEITVEQKLSMMRNNMDQNYVDIKENKDAIVRLEHNIRECFKDVNERLKQLEERVAKCQTQ